jgi:hypothetical protein
MDSTVRSLSCAVWLLVMCGCSFVDPRVGPAQVSCAEGEQGYGGGSTGAGYGDDGGAGCGTDSGDPCADCEGLHCCETRRACYGDRVCGCADQALDECLNAIAGDRDADAPEAGARCWDAFVASGAVAQARVSCQRTWCQQACGVP